jgi:hypothetical protein
MVPMRLDLHPRLAPKRVGTTRSTPSYSSFHVGRCPERLTLTPLAQVEA